MHNDKTEIAHIPTDNGGIFLRLRIDLTPLDHLVNDRPQVDIDPLLPPETKVKLHVDHVTRAQRIHTIFRGVRFVSHIDRHEPVSLGPLWPFIQDRVHHFPLDLVARLDLCHVNHIIRVSRQAFIITQAAELILVIVQTHISRTIFFPVANAIAVIPDIHHQQDHTGNDCGDIATMDEFDQRGDQEHPLDRPKEDHHQRGPNQFHVTQTQELIQQKRGHQHGHRDRQTVSRFHM